MVSVLHFCVAWAFPVLDSNDIDLQIIPAVVQVVKLGNNMWILVNMIILDIAIFLLKDCLSFPSSCNLQPPFVSSHSPMMHARWRGPIRTRTEESASMIFFPKKSPFCSIQTFKKKIMWLKTEPLNLISVKKISFQWSTIHGKRFVLKRLPNTGSVILMLFK